ncbi:MAG: hypothetical protein ACRDPY_31080 [Streptosporangiaceae bacterium]
MPAERQSPRSDRLKPQAGAGSIGFRHSKRQAQLEGLADGEDYFDLLADDVVFEYVISVPGYPRRVEGRPGVIDLYGGYDDYMTVHTAGNLRVYRDPEASVAVLEYEVHGPGRGRRNPPAPAGRATRPPGRREYGGNPADFGNASVAGQNQVFANALAADGESNWSAYDGC